MDWIEIRSKMMNHLKKMWRNWVGRRDVRILRRRRRRKRSKGFDFDFENVDRWKQGSQCEIESSAKTVGDLTKPSWRERKELRSSVLASLPFLFSIVSEKITNLYLVFHPTQKQKPSPLIPARKIETKPIIYVFCLYECNMLIYLPTTATWENK